jgi:lysophospholipase L1-like esterase
MSTSPPSERAAGLGKLFLALGALLFVLAALASPSLVARVHFRLPLSSEALEETHRSRVEFALAGLALLAAGAWIRRPGAAPWLSPTALRACLVGLGVVLPVFVFERAARPFVERLTTLFRTDALLGWTNRPGTEDTYWGEPVRINAQGMRGPERAPAKPAGVRRVLVLGDSVVFGLMLADDAETFPAQLERALAQRAGGAFECLDAGVPGWATREERLFLEREGERWQPDLVVLAFVLNDVTEPGAHRGAAQLAYARPASLPAWLADDGIYLSLRELAFRRALAGDSPAAEAHRQRLTPYHVILQSDSAPVQAAWKQVLPELEGVLAWCRARTTPLVLVVFPFALQLLEPESNAPQWILAQFAGRRALPCLDLLPPFVAALRERGLAPEGLFRDGLHPTALGNALAAEETARFVVEHALLP